MKRPAVLALVALAGTAQAAETVVTARLVPGGIELDGSSGPKTYLCIKERMTAQIAYNGKNLTFAGKYLSILFNDSGVSFNSSDKELPRLASNEVRLTCKAGKVSAKAGADIVLEEPGD